MYEMSRVFCQNSAAIYENDEGTMYFHTADVSLSENLSLEASAKSFGTYVFCGGAGADKTLFLAELQKYLTRGSFRILWIENPQEPYSRWRCFSISDLDRGAVLTFGNYHLVLKGKTELSCREGTLLLSGDFSFIYAGRNGQKMECAGQDGKIELAAFGGDSGTMRFSVKTEKDKDAFEGLHTGIQYAMPVPKETKRAKQRGFLSRAGVLVLKNGYELLLRCSLTPHALFDESRSYFLLPKQSYESSLTDRIGRMIRLYGEGKLVFEKEALYTYFDSAQKKRRMKSTYYLGIEGVFEPDRREILLGLSGTEFAGEVDGIALVPHGNGLLETEEEDSGQESPDVTAPFMSFRGNYYSASKNSAFFEKQSGYFRCSEVKAAVHKEFSPDCPVMFWREAGFADVEEARRIDALIYRKRFGKLTEPLNRIKAEKTEQERIIITAQGLCAGISGKEDDWDWIGIAQTGAGRQGSDRMENPDIRLNQIKPGLRFKFLDRDTLFCFRDRQEFLSLCEPSDPFCLQAGGWRFLLHPGYWNDNTRMIFKYTDLTSVAEYMSGDAGFCEMIEKAYDGSGAVRKGYETFISAVTDRYYQGIVLLNLKVEMTELSEELSVIMSGVDKDKLQADFAAVRRSRIYEDEKRGIYMAPSDVSAVITYCGDPIVGGREQADYDFQTTEMTVVIENSAVKSFDSTSELLINNLFHSSVSVQDTSDGNCLVVRGSLQQSGGVSSYCFTLLKRVVYMLKNSAVLSVCVEGLSMHDNAGQSEFSLSGTALTVQLEECDLFAYGAGEKGLSFQGLTLIRPKADAGMYSDYTGLRWGNEREGIRPDSLASQYGAVLEDFVMGQETGYLDNMGYCSINTPVRQEKLVSPWLGFVWRIGLGTPGGLSSEQDISLNLMAAWSQGAQGEGVSYYVGLKLPAVLNGGFNLQGLLKVGFQSISLLKDKKDRFLFRFHNITVKALCFEFPPGSTDIYIFAEQGKTGWYAAYTDEEGKQMKRLEG